MKIFLAILFMALGAAAIFFPRFIFIIRDSWKVDEKAEPNDYYILAVRIAGAIVLVMGGVLLASVLFGPKEEPVTIEDLKNPQVEVVVGDGTVVSTDPAEEGQQETVASVDVREDPVGTAWFFYQNNNTGVTFQPGEYDYAAHITGTGTDTDGTYVLIIDPVEFIWNDDPRWSEWGNSEGYYAERNEKEESVPVRITEQTEIHFTNDMDDADVYEKSLRHNDARECVTNDLYLFMSVNKGSTAPVFIILDTDGSAKYVVAYPFT